MRICRTIAELREDIDAARGAKMGFVPTMGAFHDGHLELMRQARLECQIVVVSLFVNPTQFAPHEDLSAYPRQEAQDFKLAEGVGVDVMFCPSAEEMYEGGRTQVTVSGVSQLWEGQQRPTHFAGVATIVCKLFNIVRPDIAYFGLKDLQQCAVIRTMVRDLNIPIELQFIETVRESDGLALSSRNAYLTPEERELAPTFHATLVSVAKDVRAGTRSIKDSLLIGHEQLRGAGFVVDYLAPVDPVTMEEVTTIAEGTRLMAAIRLGKVRLLDNVPV